MTFIRDNLLKIVILIVAIIIITIAFSSCSKKTFTTQEKYEVMEEELKTKAITFTKTNPRYLPKEVNEKTKLNMRVLVSNELMNQFYANEDSNIACTGYVSIRKLDDESYKYVPYIKCGKYYETFNLSNYIIKNSEIVVSDEGLYKYSNKYIFRGENINNYIKIGEDIFRIISFDDSGLIRVISEKKYDRSVWDDRYNSSQEKDVGINNYEKSRMKEFLEKAYLTDTEYFNPTLKSMIVPHDICVGSVPEDNTDFFGTAECSTIVPNQYLGLLQTNEYYIASVDEGCKSMKNPECGNYNYFYNLNSYSLATQNISPNDTYQVAVVSGETIKYVKASTTFNIYLTFYLDSDILYGSGDGSSINPYVLR